MPDLGGGRHRALAPAARQALLDRHRRRDAVDRVDLGPARRLHDAARVGVQRLEVASLAFVEQDVERQRALARARHAGDDAELAARDRDVERLQVVLAGVDDADRFVDRRTPARGAHHALQRPAFLDALRQAERDLVVGQRAAGVRGRVVADVFGRAGEHQLAAGLAAFGPEVDHPVGRADHVEVVLDHDHRVPGVEQLAQRAHQLGDVVEVQAGGRLVEQVQRALARQPLCRRADGLGQEAGQLQALRLAARQRRHRLAQAHVLEADIDDRLQHAQHLAVVGEQLHRFADGQVERVGDRRVWRSPRTIFTSSSSAR